MYRVKIKDDKFNELMFKFASMEEVSVFVETALKCSESDVDVTIEKTKEEA